MLLPRDNGGAASRSHPNHVWSCDFVFIKDVYSGKISMLAMIFPKVIFFGHEFVRKCLTIYCTIMTGSIQAIEQLANAIIESSIPECMRSDNGSEFITKELSSWLSDIGVNIVCIEPGSPWEISFCESFNGAFRNNFLDGKIFYSLKEPLIIVGEWVTQMIECNPFRGNHVSPQGELGCRSPAPQTQVSQLIQNQHILLQWFTRKKLFHIVNLN